MFTKRATENANVLIPKKAQYLTHDYDSVIISGVAIDLLVLVMALSVYIVYV